jgi:hypothetical protein
VGADGKLEIVHVDGTHRQSLEIEQNTVVVFPLSAAHGGGGHETRFCPRNFSGNIRLFAYITVNEDTVKDVLGETLSQWITPESTSAWTRLAPLLHLWHLARHTDDPALRRAMEVARNRLQILFRESDDEDDMVVLAGMSNTEFGEFIGVSPVPIIGSKMFASAPADVE